MTANRFDLHLLILPEDDANRQIANGFYIRYATRQIQVLQEARGWPGVGSVFETDYVRYMRQYSKAFMALIVDFDGRDDRLAAMRKHIPEDLAPRVFVFGAWTEPEALKRDGLGTFEQIGEALASDCPPGPEGVWSRPLLRHNADEVARFHGSGCAALMR